MRNCRPPNSFELFNLAHSTKYINDRIVEIESMWKELTHHSGMEQRRSAYQALKKMEDLLNGVIGELSLLQFGKKETF